MIFKDCCDEAIELEEKLKKLAASHARLVKALESLNKAYGCPITGQNGNSGECSHRSRSSPRRSQGANRGGGMKLEIGRTYRDGSGRERTVIALPAYPYHPNDAPVIYTRTGPGNQKHPHKCTVNRFIKATTTKAL